MQTLWRHVKTVTLKVGITLPWSSHVFTHQFGRPVRSRADNFSLHSWAPKTTSRSRKHGNMLLLYPYFYSWGKSDSHSERMCCQRRCCQLWIFASHYLSDVIGWRADHVITTVPATIHDIAADWTKNSRRSDTFNSHWWYYNNTNSSTSMALFLRYQRQRLF